MNSEKVKKIKRALEEYIRQYSNFKGAELCEEALTLINELESENERLKDENRILLDKDTLLEKVGLLSKEKDILLNRIAELESENETKTDTITDLLKKQEFYEKEKLKQFAERLKKKVHERDYVQGYAEIGLCEDIDETLKEFELCN